MLAFGTTELAAEATAVSTPPAPMLNVLIWPLLEAIRNWPSGVAASEMPLQASSVRPEATGVPAAVRAPLVGSMENALMVWSPPLETNNRLSPALRARRFTEEQAALAPSPPVGTGEPARAVSVPSTATENPLMLFAVAVWLLTNTKLAVGAALTVSVPLFDVTV